MNDDELAVCLKEIETELESLGKAEGLGKKEKKHSHFLDMRKNALLRIKQAREKGNWTEEYQQLAMYGLLIAAEDKNPMFLRLGRQRLGMNIF